MAIYHCSISNVSRAKGASSCATLAYISGEKVHDDRTGTTYAYSRQERVLKVGTILPPSAPAEYANAATLFNAIEKHEAADNARTAKKIVVALPKELELAENKAIIEDYIKHNLTKEGYAATYAIHDDGKKGNTHAHILVTNRPINAKGEWGCKRKMAYAMDENGEKIPLLGDNGKQKTDSNGRKQWKRINIEQNLLDKKEFLQELRAAYALEVNKYLEPSQQIDCRSNADRGIEETPMIHEGYAARQMEDRGYISERCQINREIREENRERKALREKIEAASAELEKIEKKESVLNERFDSIRRRKNDLDVRRITERKRTITSENRVSSSVDTDNSRARTKDYAAELIAHRRTETEREITRISKEREEVARREREAEAAKCKEREKIERKRKRDRSTDERDYTFSR